MSFSRRKIDVSFQIAGPQGPVASGGSALATSGLRVQATISKTGTLLPTAQLRIYGLPLSVMNQLSTIGKPLPGANQNTVTISAGDASGMSLVFLGNIHHAYSDFNEQPESPFVVEAQTLGYAALATVAPTSYSGSVDVSEIISFLAQSVGMKFENHGVSVKISRPYLRGPALKQIADIARAAHVGWSADNGVIALYDLQRGKDSSQARLISPSTGLIGYPRYSQFWIGLDTLFDASLVPGTWVQVQSQITPACGAWLISGVTHQIDAETPDGAWKTTLDCWNPKSIPPSQGGVSE